VGRAGSSPFRAWNAQGIFVKCSIGGARRDVVAKAVRFRGADVAVLRQLTSHHRKHLGRTRRVAGRGRPERREPHMQVFVGHHPGHRMIRRHGGVLVGMLLRGRHLLLVGGRAAAAVTAGGKDI